MIFHNDNYHITTFLKNKEMNEIYASYGIMSFSIGLISIFVPIYLYNLHYSFVNILFYFFLVALGFIIFSYVGIHAVSRFGTKHSMLLSAPFLIIYFIGLKFLPQFPILFYILPFLLALKMNLYNYAFHLNFVEHSDKKDTGKEIATIRGTALFAGALAPFIGSIIVKDFSFNVLFIVGAILLFFSMLPLFITRDTKEPLRFSNESIFKGMLKKENYPIILSFFGYAAESWIGSILWPIFLIIILTKIESVGIIFSLTMMLSLIILYTTGKQTDVKDKKKLLKTGTLFYSLGWVGRFFVGNFLVASLVDVYKNLSLQKLQVPWGSYCYDIARKTDYFKFIVQREIIYNITRIFIMPVLILIFIINFHPFYISFALATLLSLLYAKLAKYK